jgi:hypothetical protein
MRKIYLVNNFVPQGSQHVLKLKFKSKSLEFYYWILVTIYYQKLRYSVCGPKQLSYPTSSHSPAVVLSLSMIRNHLGILRRPKRGQVTQVKSPSRYDEVLPYEWMRFELIVPCDIVKRFPYCFRG